MRMGTARLLMVVALFTLTVATTANAQSWTEVRRVNAVAGVSTTIALDDDAVVIEDAGGVVRGLHGRALLVTVPASGLPATGLPATGLPATGLYRIILNRVALGRLELIIDARSAELRSRGSDHQEVPAVVSAAAAPVATAPAEIRRSDVSRLALSAAPRSASGPMTNFSSSPASRPAPSMMPPIRVPTRPLVLSTPPGSNFQTSPWTADVPPMTPTNSHASNGANGSVGPSVVEVSVPRGSSRPSDSSLLSGIITKPGELAIFSLAMDLKSRGLYGDAIVQFRRLLAEHPATQLKEAVLANIGYSLKARGAEMEAEAVRQADLRRSGAANEATDAAIRDYAAAIAAFRDLMRGFPQSPDYNQIQLSAAQSLHGVIRAQFQKGGVPQDSPGVVVEYLRSFVGRDETGARASARLGIAQYYRDLADARMMARQDHLDVRLAYDRAISEYREITDSEPVSPAAEEALIDMARLYDRNLEMRSFDSAVRAYNELVRRFPQSRFAEEARTRSRWLRENYL